MQTFDLTQIKVDTGRLLGRTTAGAGGVEPLTPAMVTAMLDVAGASKGLMSSADKAKLDGIAAGATVNSADATLLARANHTGTQAAGTITGLAAIATSGSGSDITAGTVPATRLPTFGTAAAGIVPQSGGGTVNFLRADGSWAAPPAGGGGIADGDKGDITVSASGATWTIDAGAVSFTKIQQIFDQRILGNVSGATANVNSLTGAQVTGMLNTFTDVAKGLAPASGGGTTNFLRADGAWAAPAGGGGALALGGKVHGRHEFLITAQSGFSANLQSVGVQTALSGSIGTVSPSGTTAATRLPRFNVTSAATANATSEIRCNDAIFFPGGHASNIGGFKTVIRWGWSDSVATAHMFAGVKPGGSIAATTNPNTLVNAVGVGQIAGSANLHLISSGSAAQATVDLGAGFPASPSIPYELELSSEVGTASIAWRLTRLDTGATTNGTASGVNCPANTVALCSQVCRSNNGTAASVVLQFSKIVGEVYT